MIECRWCCACLIYRTLKKQNERHIALFVGVVASFQLIAGSYTLVFREQVIRSFEATLLLTLAQTEATHTQSA